MIQKQVSLHFPKPLPSKPTVAVVSSFYNRSDCVDESVTSLLQQTYSNVKIFLVDDGSTDDTLARLKEYERYENVRVVTGPNLGFTRVMAKSIGELIDTDLVAIHGSGDISHPDRIAKQVEALKANRIWVIVGCWVRNIDQHGKVSIYHQRSDMVSCDDLIYSNYYTHGEVMFRRDEYLAAGGYRSAFPVAQDRDMWLRLLQFGSGGFVPDFLYERMIRDDGLHANPFKKSLQKALSDAACKCILMRRACGVDIIDLVGDAGVLLLNGDPSSADYFMSRHSLLDSSRAKEKTYLEAMTAIVRTSGKPDLFEKYRQNGRLQKIWKGINRALIKARESLASFICRF